MVELHSELAAALGARTKVGRIAEHFGKGNFCVYNLCACTVVGRYYRTAAGGYVAHYIAEIVVGGDYLNLHYGFEQNCLCLFHTVLERHRAGNLECHFGGVYLVVASVVNLYFEVNHFVPCKEAVLGRALNTLVDCGDIFLGNRAADGEVFEHVARTGFAGNEVDFAVAVLTFTAGLPLVKAFGVNRLLEGFAVGNLGSAHVCLYLEFTQKPVHDDIEVEFAHTCDYSLTGLLVGVGLEGGVLFGELYERHRHLFLTGLGLGLDGELDNGVGEGHLFENDGMSFVAERVAGSGVFEADYRADIARVNAGNFCTVVCVHLNETAYALPLTLGRVIYVGTGLQHARVCSEICKPAHEGVGCNLECEARERFVVGRPALFLFARLGVDTLYVVNVHGGRKEVDNGVEKHLNALVLIGRTAEHGGALHIDGSFAEALSYFVGGEFHSFEELLHKLVVALGCDFHNFHMKLFRLSLHICGNFVFVVLFAVVGIVNFGIHFDEVDYSAEGSFLTDGKLDGNGVGREPLPHHSYGALEVCAVDVHFIYVGNTGHLVFICLAPYRFRLGLNAALCAESCDGAVENAERTLNFYGEVNVARGVYDVDTAFVSLGLAAARPVAGGCGGSDGYAALLLLHHPVHSSGAVVRFADFMIDARIIQYALGSRSLACVYVRHYTYIAGVK